MDRCHLTVRAIAIGFLLVLTISALGYFNDWVLQLSFVASDLVPLCAFGVLIVVLLGINPVLRLVRCRPFLRSELAVIISLVLVASVVPGAGLMWNFTNTLIMPRFYQQNEPGWRRHDLVGYVPPVMLADPAGDDEAMTGFNIGLYHPNRSVGLGDVPWRAWGRTLAFWLPLLGLGFVATLCLMLILHRQWSARERLRYPIAAFATLTLEGTDQGYWPTLFRNGRFWIGLLISAGILLVNGVAFYFPKSISIPMQVNVLPSLIQKWPGLSGVPNVESALNPTFHFIAIGLAYFVGTEVSFSVGISAVAYLGLYALLAGAGITLGGSYFEAGPQNALLAGAYVGAGITIFYLGRRYFGAVLAQAFALGSRDHVESSAVWACRIGLAAAVAMVLMLHLATGLGWGWAILFLLLTGLLFMVVARIVAETGLFLVQPNWQAVSLMVSVFGLAAIGPTILITLALLSAVITIDPRVCLMPMAANALKISEDQGIRPQRITRWMGASVLLALATAVIATLYVQYRYGTYGLYPFANIAAKLPFQLLERAVSGTSPSWAEATTQLGNLTMDMKAVAFAAAGLGGVVLLRALRLRYVWWPIHPVLLLVWGTMPSDRYAASFLAGWAIKAAICRLGGSRSYERNKPLFVGLLAGDFLAAMVLVGVGLAYHAATGLSLPAFRTHT